MKSREMAAMVGLALVAGLAGSCSSSTTSQSHGTVTEAEQVVGATMGAAHPAAAPAPSATPAAAAPSAMAEALLVDNFDAGSKPNALGGDFGSWDKDPNDPTQFTHISFDKENAYGGVGYALRVDYDVDSPNPAYNGFWAKLNTLDVSSRHMLSFNIKGDAAKGYTTALKLELKNDHEKGTYVLKGLTDQWQKATIALSDFKGLTELTKLTEFVIVFDDITATQKVGTLYLDDVAFN